MKIQNQDTLIPPTQTSNKNSSAHINGNYEEILSSLTSNTVNTPITTQSNEQLLLLLQGSSAYTGYLAELAQQEILTDAERNYLLSGDTKFIEKKNFLL